jgi:hypothetical protein
VILAPGGLRYVGSCGWTGWGCFQCFKPACAPSPCPRCSSLYRPRRRLTMC